MNATLDDEDGSAVSLRDLIATPTGRLIAVGVLALAAFHLATAWLGQFAPYIQRSIHLGLALALLYLSRSQAADTGLARRGAAIGAAILAAVACGYILFVEERLVRDFMTVAKSEEILLGTLLLLLVLDGARRTTGPVLPLLTLAILGYSFGGHLIPGTWGHPGFSLSFLLEHLYLGTEGIWGSVTGLSASLVAIFILFGAVMLATGTADTFIKIAILVAGRSPGGAAKVATFASALFGMLNGAAVANVATTGAFTIPTMKRLGYRPQFAGAVEATASSGGQITPPIMGVGAFVMAEMLAVPYLEIVYAAIVPAFLFYLCVWISIDVEARRENMRAYDTADIPDWREVVTWRRIGPLGLTVGVLLLSLFRGNTPVLAAFYAIATNVVLYLLSGDWRPAALRMRLGTLLEGAVAGARAIYTLVPLLVCAQITLSLISLTGIGVKLSQLIIGVGDDGGLLLGSLLAALVALIMGMGMPTTAAYLLASAVAAPALSELGLPLFTSHFFIFYCALLSALTPPVCTAVFTAAIIARTSWWPLALTSMRLAAMKYVLPFFFIFRPETLLIGSLPAILWGVVVGAAAAFLFAIGIGGYYRRPLHPVGRLACVAAAFALVAGAPAADAAGLLTCAGVVLYQIVTARKAAVARFD